MRVPHAHVGSSLGDADRHLDHVRHRRREVPLVKEARFGWVAREYRRLVEGGGDQ